MKPILVTGSNKGIGLALVSAILDQHDDTVVFLGSRDPARGQAAVAGLCADHPAWGDRLHLVVIDVTDDATVAAAVDRVRDVLGDQPLYGLVNNAGIGFQQQGVRRVLDVNTLGMQRVTEAFLPLLDPDGGRVVNITSGAAPNYVVKTDPRRHRELCGIGVDVAGFEALVDEVLGFDGEADFQAAGLGDGEPYGLSKALANTYTAAVAAAHPNLVINACTPGFIETDLTRPFAEARGMDPEEMGMKPTSAATVAPMKLLFADLPASGWYFGSDAERSPMHVYRSPGDPPYDGSAEPA